MKLFSERVYELCKRIPKGKVTTYGDIAKALRTKGYQAVGNALRCNPYAPVVPCHKVVKRDGSIGGFKGKINGKEIEEKIKLLTEEGVKIENKRVNLRKYLFNHC